MPRISKKAVAKQKTKSIDTLVNLLKEIDVAYEIKGSSIHLLKNVIIYYDVSSQQYVMIHGRTGNTIESFKTARKVAQYIKNAVSKVSPNLAGGVANQVIKKHIMKEHSIVSKWHATADYKDKVAEKIMSDEELLSAALEPVKMITIYDSYGKEVEAYAGVYNEEQKKVVSVVRKSYQLYPNSLLVEPALNFLVKSGIDYKIGNFSLVTDSQMRLQLVLQSFQLKDDTEQGLYPSIILSNSYDMTSTLSINIGALRVICSNGMVTTKTLNVAKRFHRTSDIGLIQEEIMNALQKIETYIPAIERRIQEMMNKKLVGIRIKALSHLDSRLFSHLMQSIGIVDEEVTYAETVRIGRSIDPNFYSYVTEWQAYNILTEFITHQVPTRYKMDFSQRLSKIMNL